MSQEFDKLISLLEGKTDEQVANEVSKYPCGCDKCFAGHPDLCQTDCIRNGRQPTEDGD